MAKIKYTKLNNLNIVRFRGLVDTNVVLGNQITLICGKNGTSKSSILGIAAQIFSFEKDHTSDEVLSYRTIAGEAFKSNPREHFRFSDQFDSPHSMQVKFSVHDGYTDKTYESELELTTRTTPTGTSARPVVRGNTSVPGANESRNYTHPVIYLSLKRLMPIPMRGRYSVVDYEYLKKHEKEFIALNNELLNKTSISATGTSGSINSAVAFGANYNQDSVSAGEDNAGQIVMALMSFKKLKSEYKNYHGGLLLIDEADAGLFPAAQLKLIDMLHRECNDLGIQVVMTSHSPEMIQKVYEYSQTYQRNFKTAYLTDSFGAVRSRMDMSWSQIYADLRAAPLLSFGSNTLPVPKIYFEDGEAQDFYNAIMLRQSIRKHARVVTNVSMGCDNYLKLLKLGVSEFSVDSLIVLDADAKAKAAGKKNVLVLPGKLPPDQLIFEYLYNLEDSDEFWVNEIMFTKSVFRNAASDVISTLRLGGGPIDLFDIIRGYQDSDEEKRSRLRKLFKNFYKKDEFQALLSIKNPAHHPWRKWVGDNHDDVIKFRSQFVASLKYVLKNGYGINDAKLSSIIT